MAQVLSRGRANDEELEKHGKCEVKLMLDDVIVCLAWPALSCPQAVHSASQLSRPGQGFTGVPRVPTMTHIGSIAKIFSGQVIVS
jgi:hypothetical protein